MAAATGSSSSSSSSGSGAGAAVRTLAMGLLFLSGVAQAFLAPVASSRCVCMRMHA